MSGPGAPLAVVNLAWAVTEADLRALFERFGPIRTARVCTDPVTGRSRGFGFVEFEAGARVDLDAVIAATTGQVFRGRALRVERARPRGAR
jgi:RNA recognition motif-containing protein